MELCGIEESLVVALQHSKPQIIEDVQALHNKEKKDSLWQKMKQNWFECPIDDIRDYFGKFCHLSKCLALVKGKDF